ncbi:MAG: hypothetical protein V5A62_00310 [Haloarculaceae archaeon]
MDAPSTPHTRRGVLATGATALAAGVAGCVGFAGPDVVVDFLKAGRSQEALDAVTVESEPEDGDLVVRTSYEDGFRNASVDLTVRVPDGGTVGSVETANGDAVVRAVTGDVRATTTNGDLDVEVELDRASVSARRARGRLGDGGPLLTLASGNGDVRLYELQG